MGSDARSLGLAQMARPDCVRQLQVELESERAHHMSKARPPRMTVMSAAAALAPYVRPLPTGRIACGGVHGALQAWGLVCLFPSRCSDAPRWPSQATELDSTLLENDSLQRVAPRSTNRCGCARKSCRGQRLHSRLCA